LFALKEYEIKKIIWILNKNLLILYCDVFGCYS
jgi:hypothetical protein